MHPLSQFGLRSTHSLMGGIEVFVFDISADGAPETSDVLSDAERAQARSMRSADARATFMRSRRALRQTLGWLCASAPADLDIRISAHGKPYLHASGGPQPSQFNLSHSGKDLAIAVGRGMPVGVDIERRDQAVDALSVAEHFFRRNDVRQLRALDDSQRQDAFLRIWVRKEAAAKAAGLGLGSVPAQTDLTGTIGHSEPSQIDLEGRYFQVIDLPRSEHLIGAVAVELGADA